VPKYASHLEVSTLKQIAKLRHIFKFYSRYIGARFVNGMDGKTGTAFH